MLEALRSAAGTWVAKLLLVILVVSFAVWGISGQMVTGFGGDSVITAGGTRVSMIEYRLAYDRQIAVMSQRLGTRLTREQAAAFGIDGLVLQQLVSDAVLNEQASELGLGLSEVKLAALTMEDPAFFGPNGRFDRAQFEYVLRQIGMQPKDYLKSRAQAAIRQQVVDAVSDGIKVPDTFLRGLALHRGEDRTAE
jgi:peptidyl-prolyl cis-trans isomerase D